MNEHSIVPGSDIGALVRGVIDTSFATQLSMEDLTSQLVDVAGEMQAARGLRLGTFEVLRAMRSLANELHTQPTMALAA